jgi:hypothetical protein
MSNEKWVQKVIWVVVFLNLVVICQVFIIPRTDFIVRHLKESREALQESSGPLDMPNQYVHTYKLMRKIGAMTSENSLILFPPDDWEFGSPRSAIIQRLYPRKVYFSNDSGFDRIRSQASNLGEAYVVFNDNWGKELCQRETKIDLGELGFGICQIGKT